jgi:hypothetical protein
MSENKIPPGVVFEQGSKLKVEPFCPFLNEDQYFLIGVEGEQRVFVFGYDDWLRLRTEVNKQMARSWPDLLPPSGQ